MNRLHTSCGDKGRRYTASPPTVPGQFFGAFLGANVSVGSSSIVHYYSGLSGQ